MTRAIRDAYAALRDLAPEYGVRVLDTGHARKHPWAMVEHQGRRHKLVFAGSPKASTPRVKHMRKALAQIVRGTA